MTITLTGQQVKNLLDFAAPDGGEQLEHEVTIFSKTEGGKCSETGEYMPPGVYAYATEYPELGCVHLDHDIGAA